MAQKTRLSAKNMRSLKKRLLILREKLEKRKAVISAYAEIYKFPKRQTARFIKKASQSIKAIDLLQQIDQADIK